MTYNFANCGISNNYKANLFERYQYLWIENRSTDLYRVVFSTIATYLKTLQDKSKRRSVFKLLDMKNNFVFAAIMTYHKPEDESDDDKGNWSLEFSFDEKDTENADAVYDNLNETFCIIASNEAHTIMHGRFNENKICNNMMCEAITTLKEWLDDNANLAEEVQLELPGVFTATVGVENGTKIMGVIAGEIIRQMIKSDDIL